MDDKKKFPPEEEPKVKLYRLKIALDIEAESIDEARNLAERKLRLVAKEKVDAKVSRVVQKKYSSRTSRLDEARGLLGQARDIVEELKGEVQEWHDNLPENFQNGDKGQALEECAQNLE